MSLLKNASVSSLLIAASAVSVTSALVVWILQKYRYKYQKVARIKKLFVKSLQGVEVDFLEVTKTGVRHGAFRDRSWVITDGEDRMMSLYSDTRLALLKTSFHEDHLWIDAPNDMPTLRLQIKTQVTASDIVVDIDMFGAKIKGLDCGQAANQWLQDFLGKPGIKIFQHLPDLGYTPTRTFGKKDPSFGKQFPIIYQNKSDVHMVLESSLLDLNKRITDTSGTESQVDAHRFRPNIVADESLAWDEDHWYQVRVKDMQMVQVMSCNRCLQTTISRENAEKEQEPLKTLRKFRLTKDPKLVKKWCAAPLFGGIYGTLTEGIISVGDEVEAIRVKDCNKDLIAM